METKNTTLGTRNTEASAFHLLQLSCLESSENISMSSIMQLAIDVSNKWVTSVRRHLSFDQERYGSKRQKAAKKKMHTSLAVMRKNKLLTATIDG